MSETAPGYGLHRTLLPGYVRTTAARDVPAFHAGGINVRAVVRNTRVFDEKSPLLSNNLSPRAVYCDVIAYYSVNGSRLDFIPNCLVMQPRAGLHDGDIWIPRASTTDIVNNRPIKDGTGDPMTWDGDHVIVSFLDDDLQMPIIIGSIPHPHVDRGKDIFDPRPVGERMRILKDDGHVRFVRHHGTFVGIGQFGDVIINTQSAHAGHRTGDGEEPEPPEDGSAGNVFVDVENGARVTINAGGGQSIDLAPDGTIVIGIDDGELRVNADGTISFGKEGASKNGIARLEDKTMSDISQDAQFWAWVNQVHAFIKGLTPESIATAVATYNLAVPAPPIQLQSEIITASARVETE